MRLAVLVVSMTVCVASAADAQTIVAHDPAATIAIAEWFAAIPPEEPPATPVPLPVDPDIANVIAPVLALEAARGAAPPLPGEAGVLLPRAAIGSCTLDVVRATSVPVMALNGELLDRAAERGIARFGNGEPWLTFRAGLSGLPLPGYTESAPYTLAEAAALDRVDGGTYWTARWHQYHAMIHASFVMRSVGTAFSAAGQAAADGLPPRFGNPLPQDPVVTDDEIRAAFQPFLDLRTRILATVGAWMSALDAASCEGVADFVRVRASVLFANGDEYRAFFGLGREYWAAYALGGLHYSGIIRTVGLGFGDATAALDRALRPVTVESLLGPMPPAPGQETYEAVDVAVAPSPGPVADEPVPPVGDPVTPVPASGNAPAQPAVPNWDAPVRAAGGGASAGTPGAPAAATLINAAGAGELSQAGLAGLWRLAGEDGRLTLIRVADDGVSFTGLRIDDGALGDRWIEMVRTGETAGWRGTIDIGTAACPLRRDGVFVADPSQSVLTATVTGAPVDPVSCEGATNADGAAIVLERVVATTFRPIVAGRFIHLVTVPGGGGTQAIIAFGCESGAVPATALRVTVSGGSVMETGPCRYELSAAMSGTYDITVEFVDEAGGVLHTDRLRAVLPAIPGVFP